MYNEARFSILVSKTENFGNTILESLLCKTPVIISKNTGLSDYIKKKKIGIICGEEISELISYNTNIRLNYKYILNYIEHECAIKVWHIKLTINI